MALFHVHFFSEALGMQCQAEVVLPQPTSDSQIGVDTASARNTWPCLWLLHGLSDDHTIWSRRTSIERYAEARGLAVVMPNAHRSFYADMAHGGAYYAFLTEELPRIMRGFFPLSDRQEDNAVAGLSMGVYGAMKWLLDRPGELLAGVSLSGALDMKARIETLRLETDPSALRRQAMHLVYDGVPPEHAPDNLLVGLTERAAAGNARPMRVVCGTEDFLYEDNLAFRDRAQALALPITYTEGPGAHEWTYWDQEIVPALDWLLEQGLGA